MNKDWIEEEITLAEFAERFLDLNDFITPQVINIEDLNVEILGRDLEENKDSWEKVTHFIVKPSVETHYTDGILKGTSEHKVIENKKEIALKNHPDYKEVKEPMHVVDISVDNIENYYSNGKISRNTTPGGKALKFAASVRIKLMGKT